MSRRHHHSGNKHRVNKPRRAGGRDRQQPWGGLKPIITGALGEAKHHATVASIAHGSRHAKRAA